MSSCTLCLHCLSRLSIKAFALFSALHDSLFSMDHCKWFSPCSVWGLCSVFNCCESNFLRWSFPCPSSGSSERSYLRAFSALLCGVFCFSAVFPGLFLNVFVLVVVVGNVQEHYVKILLIPSSSISIAVSSSLVSAVIVSPKVRSEQAPLYLRECYILIRRISPQFIITRLWPMILGILLVLVTAMSRTYDNLITSSG